MVFGVVFTFTTMIFVFGAVSHSATDISGTFKNESYIFPGPLTISGTGGNVPHGCYYKSIHSASASTLTISCAAGEITTGGGVSCGDPAKPLTSSEPSSDLTNWTGTCSGAADMDTYAVCCKI